MPVSCWNCLAPDISLFSGVSTGHCNLTQGCFQLRSPVCVLLFRIESQKIHFPHHFWDDSYLQNCCVRQLPLSGMGQDRGRIRKNRKAADLIILKSFSWCVVHMDQFWIFYAAISKPNYFLKFSLVFLQFLKIVFGSCMPKYMWNALKSF